MSGERALVARILERIGGGREGVEVGPGDDAAVVRLGDRRLVLTVDSQREGTHYREGWIDPRALGRRALAVAVSDVGAMGAEPRWSLAALAAPRPEAGNWVEEVSAGLAAAAVEHGCPLVGGDVSVAPRPEIVVTVVGEIGDDRPAVGRGGARPGDECWVFGPLGLAAAGRELLSAADEGGGGGSPDTPATGRCVDAWRHPRPPVGLGAGLSRAGLVRAMMDVSDGLGIDLARMCEASGCGARIDAAALHDDDLDELAAHFGRDPLGWAIAGGDDYALLCAVQVEDAAAVAEAAAREGVSARRIGAFVTGDAIPALVLSSGELAPLEGGWDPLADEGA